ncbi:MAG: hypothetical protein GX994_06660 [Firmicutes bacterium]|nr:hypothetical protein [Bacillota bacterium]
MLKEKGYLGGFIALIAVALLVVVVLVTSAQGQSSGQIGVVNMETVFTQYMAAPLFEARDEMQAEYDNKVENLADEEASQLFMEYQVQLETLENEYSNNVEAAIKTVAEKHGFQIIVDSAAVLHGGIDVTEDVLEVLK